MFGKKAQGSFIQVEREFCNKFQPVCQKHTERHISKSPGYAVQLLALGHAADLPSLIRRRDSPYLFCLEKADGKGDRMRD